MFFSDFQFKSYWRFEFIWKIFFIPSSFPSTVNPSANTGGSSQGSGVFWAGSEGRERQPCDSAKVFLASYSAVFIMQWMCKWNNDGEKWWAGRLVLCHLIYFSSSLSAPLTNIERAWEIRCSTEILVWLCVHRRQENKTERKIFLIRDLFQIRMPDKMQVPNYSQTSDF